MSESDRNEHLRVNYIDEDQLWPEYLDFLDEWDHNSFFYLNQTRNDFVFHVLARRRQVISCGDHHHMFSTEIIPGVDAIIVSSPDMYSNPDACWQKTIANSDEMLRRFSENSDVPRLSCPEASALKQLAALKMVHKGHLPPTRLTFEQFSKDWVPNPSQQNAMNIYHKSITPIVSIPQTLIASEIHKDKRELKSTWIYESGANNKEAKVIYPQWKVYEMHSFHTFLLARADFKTMLKMISDIRGENPDYSLLISKIKACNHCRFNESNHPNQHPGMSYPALYYAPPGNGKSTSGRKCLFIGVDTDWLLKRSNFETIVKPFLDMGIPVLTNQYHLGLKSGIRMFGNFNADLLRTDLNNRPFTSVSEIHQIKHLLRDDIFLTFMTGKDLYLTDLFLMLYRAAYIYNETRYRFSLVERPKFSSKSLVSPPVSLGYLLSSLAVKDSANMRLRRNKTIRKRLK